MGGGGKSKPPPPPKKPPPPAEDITAEVIAPTLRQEAARRARAGAYVTKGQKLGAQGQVLGASPIELADITKAAGIDMAERDIGEDVFKPEPITEKGWAGIKKAVIKKSEQVSNIKNLEKAGYKFSKIKGKKKRILGINAGRRPDRYVGSEQLYREYTQQLAQRRAATAEARKDRGMII